MNKIDGIRKKLNQAAAEHEQMHEGTYSSKEVVQRINDYIDRESSEFRGFNRIIENAQLLTHRVDEFNPFNIQATDNVKLSPLLCALFGEELKQKFKARIDELNLPAGLSASQRAKRIIELNEEIHDLSIQEEQLICEAESKGIEIVRRVDCDPKIVLEYKEVEELKPTIKDKLLGHVRLAPESIGPYTYI